MPGLLRKCSESSEEVLQGHAESLGEGDDRVKGRGVLAALDHPDAVAVNTRALTEPFLRQTPLLTEVAHALAELATVLGDAGHAAGP